MKIEEERESVEVKGFHVKMQRPMFLASTLKIKSKMIKTKLKQNDYFKLFSLSIHEFFINNLKTDKTKRNH